MARWRSLEEPEADGPLSGIPTLSGPLSGERGPTSSVRVIEVTDRSLPPAAPAGPLRPLLDPAGAGRWRSRRAAPAP
ncbi:MAG: hypothetical protein ACKVWR_21415, partial [Acidimicrobiales bacterium]